MPKKLIHESPRTKRNHTKQLSLRNSTCCGLCNQLRKRNWQTIRIDGDCQPDSFVFSLSRRHHKANAFGLQFFVSLIDVFHVEANGTMAGLLEGSPVGGPEAAHTATVQRQRCGSGLKLCPLRRLKLQREPQLVAIKLTSMRPCLERATTV